MLLSDQILSFQLLKSFSIIKTSEKLLNNFYNQIIVMHSNNNGSALLIDWINKQRSFQGQEHPLYDFQHVQKTGFLYSFLQKIHPQYFMELCQVNFDFQTYFATLENYLMEVEGKKIARRYKKDIIQDKSIEEIIKISLYLMLQSEQKTQYVTRIVDMNVQVQSYLMQEIQMIQENLENHVEIKDILTNIEKLEEENEALKEKIRYYNAENQELNQQVDEARQENTKIASERKKYEFEKKQIFEELQIVDMKEYVEVYRAIKNENNDMNCFIQQIQESKRQVQVQNKAMKERINQDCQVINLLNEQITFLRHNYSNIKEEMSTLSFSCDHIHESCDDSVLRQNKNFGNVHKVRFSLQTSCSDRSMVLNHFYDDEENNELDKLRNYNQQILHKLQVCHKTIADLTNEVTSLKEDKVRLEKKNGGLERKLGALKNEQNRFTRELKKIGF